MPMKRKKEGKWCVWYQYFKTTFKWAVPASFSFVFVLFMQFFDKKNCWLQRDSKSDYQSRELTMLST